MKKRESKLWQRIKKNITKPHLIRVESNTINGIPDINGCWNSKEFWIELKSDKVGYPKLSKWQISWINKRIKHGGIVIICNETLLKRSLELYRPVSPITDPRLLKPRFSFSFPIQWPTVQDGLQQLLQLPPESRSRPRSKDQRIADEMIRNSGSLCSQDLAGI
jgi:hypothetical protein|tara:strand:- start:365 stop:853 length:489 start_codon:yes stop_codon:yes gene_type:complete